MSAKKVYERAILSGDPTPSERDKLLTRDLVVAGRTMEIRVFDHLIIFDFIRLPQVACEYLTRSREGELFDEAIIQIKTF